MRSETRHQLKKDPFAEKFAQKAGDTVHWAEEHRSKLLLAGGICVVVLAIVIGGWMYRRQQEQKAALALAQAMETYSAPVVPPGTPAQPGVTTFASEKDRSKAANDQFRDVAARYSTNSGKVARYMAGVTSMELGVPADAEKDLKAVSDSAGKDLASLAKFALASVYRQTNRADEALKLYQELSDHPTRSVSKPMAQLATADLYAARGEVQRAKDLYQSIAKDNPATVAMQLASQKMAELTK